MSVFAPSPFGAGGFGSLGSAMAAGLPWPEGDGPGLASAAGKVGSLASGLNGAASRIGAAGGAAGGWQGAGAEAFRSAIGNERTAMSGSASALEHAAAALKRLSATVEEAQRTVARLAQEVRDAEDEARRAASRAADAATTAGSLGLTAALAPPGDTAAQADARIASDTAASAQASAGQAQAHAIAVRQRNTRLAQAECDRVTREDRATASAVDQAASKVPLAGVPFGAPTPATNFGRQVLGGLTQQQWREIAYWRAGIDGGAWDPSKGLLANDKIVQAVYQYYGDLFLQHPELQWAGMANLVGPMFYGGWQDLYTLRHVGDDSERAQYISELLGLPKLPGPVYDALDLTNLPLNAAGRLGEEELGWYEKKFLVMQKGIFDDLAWQHEAYSMGGIGLMRDLAQQGQLEHDPLQSWEQIASGDLAGGNEGLLHREQHDVIQGHYDEMRAHNGISGDGFTYLSSVMAGNPIPGGQAYRDFSPIQVPVPVPGVDVAHIGPVPVAPYPTIHIDHVSVPLPDGNLSNYSDRWKWISQDMYPAYQRFLQNPDAVRHLVETPVTQRADGYRQVPLPYPGG